MTGVDSKRVNGEPAIVTGNRIDEDTAGDARDEERNEDVLVTIQSGQH